MPVHGEIWTVKELFVLPNEYIYWAIQIVMYPFMTGLVAGAFVLSSLYHVFGVKALKDIARFALVFSMSLLPVAMMPLQLHLMQPLRGIEVMMTPHFTSAIAAFGIVFMTYASIVASELWFVYREHFVTTARALSAKSDRSALDGMRLMLFRALTLGAYDVSEAALAKDHKAVTILAGIGIPVACFLHGYAGFIFGSVKANALWMTPLMPVIFIMSAIVSGIALCILVYITISVYRHRTAGGVSGGSRECSTAKEVLCVPGTMAAMDATRYLRIFMIFAITLELLDIIFRGYTAVKSWDILRQVIYGKDFYNIFIFQYGVGNLLPFILLMLPGLTVRRTVVAAVLVLFGVFMMRWNVVIGGQSFSLTFSGFMHYHMPVVPSDLETFREGLGGVMLVAVTPFVIFHFLNKVMPVFPAREGR
ncbi:MAG: polysulfide reductase NrfD [Nitrospirae bacterium]|nr:polysulfide reductase NrfD [Nitrospirota bacterium]